MTQSSHRPDLLASRSASCGSRPPGARVDRARVDRAGIDRAGIDRREGVEAMWLNVFRIYWTTLDRDERDALWLVEVEGMSYASAAKTLSLSGDAVARLVLAARRRIFAGMRPTLRDLSNRAG